MNLSYQWKQKSPLSQLTLKTSEQGLNPLLNSIDSFAVKEEVDPKIIATYALMLISILSKYVNTSSVYKQIIAKGSFANEIIPMPIDKLAFMLDLLEIGRRKYTNFKRLCKSENIIFPSYSKLAQYRHNVSLTNEFVFVHNEMNLAIGIAVSINTKINASYIIL